MSGEIEGWIKVDGVWWRSPPPPHIAQKRATARMDREAEDDPTKKCPDAGPWCGACRRTHQAVVEHPCDVCGLPTTILRSICVGCGMKVQWQERPHRPRGGGGWIHRRRTPCVMRFRGQPR